MQLETIAGHAGASILQLPPKPVEVTGLSCDSRQVKAGDLFAALPGAKADGARFAAQAAAQGAVAILAEQAEPLTALPQLVCQDARLSLARAARVFFGCADTRLTLGAVTGEKFFGPVWLRPVHG